MRPGLFRAAAALLLAAAASATARAGDPPAVPQEPVRGWEALTGPAEARGLFDQAALDWAAAAAADPGSPGAEVALRRLAAARDRFASSRALQKPLEEIARSAKASPAAAFLARQLLVGYLRERGEWREAEKLAGELGCVERWLAVGPFGRNLAAAHDTVFGPETQLDLAADYDPARHCALARPKWRPLPPPPAGEALEPHAYLRPQGGACYLLAQLAVKGGRRGLRLCVETPASFKVWVNGRPVLDGDRGRGFLPREVWAAVDLELDGWNRVLVKLSAPAPLRVRLDDASGVPVLLPAEEHLVLHPPGAPAAPAGTPVPALPALPGSGGAGAAELAALGTCESLLGLDDAAAARLEAAVRLEPERAAWHFLLGEALRASELLSAPARRNLSARAYRGCLERDPGFVPAMMRLAELELEEGREEQALAGLERACAAGPGCCLARLRMAEIAADLGWRFRARAWLADAQKLRPDHPGCRLLEARLQREAGQLDRTIAEYRELVKADEGRAAHRWLLARALADRGLWREAVKIAQDGVRLRPTDPVGHEHLVGLLDAGSLFREAAAAAKPLLELVPDEAGHHRRLGEALARAGDRKAALEAYARALELDPSDSRLRRLTERASGVEEDFSAPWALDMRAELAESRKRQYPRANAVRVLDQTVVRVYPDGSLSSMVANGERALTPAAVDKLGEQPVLGEMMEARTILPDGTVLEPTPIPGQRLTMPGLAVDAAIEYKYRREERPAPWGGFHLDKWYFRSPQLDEPHQVSDYIVMVPKGLPHRVVRHNFDVPERVEERDGLTVYRWTARDRPRVDAEPHMPHFDHYLPFVEVGTERSWQDVAETFRSAYLAGTRATRLVARCAGEAVEARTGAAARARGIYEFVNRSVRHRGPYASAHQALAAGAGDREMVFIALAEAAGLEAFQGRTRRAPQFQGGGRDRRDDRPVTWELPAETHFTAELVGVRLEGGRLLWLDLSSRFMPFGEIRQELGGARVLAVPSRGPAFFDRLPAPRLELAGASVEVDAALDASGRLEGRAVFRVEGPESARERERLAALDSTGRFNLLQERLAGVFPGAVLTAADFPAAEDSALPYSAVARFELPDALLPVPGGRLVCPTGLAPLGLVSALAMDAARQHPLKLAEPRTARETLSFRLPPGLEAAVLPGAEVRTSEFGSYSLTAVRTAEGFRLERRALLPPRTVAPAEYPAFHEFCRAVDEVEKARVLLRPRSRP